MTDKRDLWAEEIEALHVDAGGVFKVYVLGPAEMTYAITAAMNGDAEAGRLVSCVHAFLANARTAPGNKPALCVSCPRELLKVRLFFIGMAAPYRTIQVRECWALACA